MQRQQLVERRAGHRSVLRAVDARRVLLELLDVQRQAAAVRVRKQVERQVGEANLGVEQLGRPGDVAVPALQRTAGRVDLENVVPAIKVVELDEQVAPLEDDVPQVTTIPREVRLQDDQIISKLHDPTLPHVLGRSVVEKLANSNLSRPAHQRNYSAGTSGRSSKTLNY